jgi:hypothetical protein
LCLFSLKQNDVIDTKTFHSFLLSSLMSKVKKPKLSTPIDTETALTLDGLTLYDIHRKPRPVILDDRTVSLPLGQLSKELQCPICLQLLNKTLTAMECLHRFCSECVNCSLRLGKKECPVCRMPCATRRSLRPDTVFDELILNMYGDVDIFQKNLTQILKETMNNQEAFQRLCTDGLRRQKEILKSENVKKKKPEIHNQTESTKVSLMLQPSGENLQHLKPKWVQVDGNAKISHIRQLIFNVLLPHTDPTHIIICCEKNDNVISDEETLFSLHLKTQKRKKDVTLIYSTS